MLASKLFVFADRRRARRRAARCNGEEDCGDEPAGFELRALAPLKTFGRAFGALILALVQGCLKNAGTRLVTIILLTGFAVGATWMFMPKMEYLPQGNRNLLISVLIPPPGQSVGERQRTGEILYEGAGPFIGKEQGPGGLPGIRDMFYVGAAGFNLFGVVSNEEQRARELIGPMMGVANSVPGTYGFTFQAGIFQNRLGGDRTIDIDLAGADLEVLAGAAQQLFLAIPGAIKGSQVRPVPSFEMTFPEVRLTPRRDRLRAAGMTASDLGITADVLMDGRKVSEFKEEGVPSIDLVLMASDKTVGSPEELYSTLLSTSDGRLVPLSSLAELTRTTGINEIRHLERRRTFTLQVTPPDTMPLEQAMEVIQGGLVPSFREQGKLPGVDVTLSGAADKLQETRQTLQWNFVLAVVIIYLLMAALFGNFIYPLVILFTVPLAGAGGFIGLRIQNLFVLRPLDVLTMLGFVILIGVVVNNAILIVHQSLNNIRDGGMEHKEAVIEAVRTRLRPIYMSAMTSIFGMLPLAVMPGPGSELYSGLGAVILSGLAFSTVFTVFVTPAMLMFFIGMEKTGTTQEQGEEGAKAG